MSEKPLRSWFTLIRLIEYESCASLKKTFASVEKVNYLFVFNIGKNKYILICVIHFNLNKVYICDVLTHKEYDKDNWK